MPSYKITDTANAGRILVATQRIKSQDKILTDTASVVAPILFGGGPIDPKFFCISCFKICLGNKKCPKCKLPICEKACVKAKVHVEDCPVLKDMFDDPDEDPNHIPTIEERFQHLVLASSCLAALRLLRQRRQKKPIGTLVSSRKSGYALANWEQDVVEMLAGCNINGKDSPIEEHEVIYSLGVWATNGVKVQRSSEYMPCVVLFAEFCLANHRCNPKAMYVPYFDKDSYKIDARAQVDIHPGDEITIRYTDALSTNWERRKACQSKWSFVCACDRCTDITEFGTNASGVICTQCDSGTMLIDNKDTVWTCQSCRSQKYHSEVWFSVLDPLDKVKAECRSKPDTNIVEQFLWTAYKMLHANHVWILDMEYRLLFLYSKKIKTMKKGKKPVQLRMLQLGLHLLEVLGVIDEGPTRWRGMVLQELVTPWMDLAKEHKAAGILSSFQFKRKVIVGMLYAENAVECLKFDPKNANMNLDRFSLHC